MHPREVDRLMGWEFDGLLYRFRAQDALEAEAKRKAAFSVVEVEN